MSTVNIPDFDQVPMAPAKLDVGKAYVGNIIELPEIKKQDDSNPDSKTFIEVKIKVLEGPNQAKPDPQTGSNSPAGRTITDRLYLTPGAYFKVKQLLVSAQLMARDDVESPMAKGKIPLENLVGARFPFDVVASIKDGTEYRNVQYVV